MSTRSQNPEDVVKDYRSSMPGNAGAVFADLWKDVVALQATWEIYSDLYGAEVETLELLDRVSSEFFITVRQSLLHQLYMLLARLTDSPFSGPKKRQHNISFSRLVHEIREAKDPDFAKELEPLVSELALRCEPVRALRHKVLAHTDFHVALKLAPQLPGITRAEFEGILRSARELMNMVEVHFRESTTIYERTIANQAVEHLLFYLRQAQASLRAQRERE